MTIRRGRFPLKAFVVTLGFSRARFIRFTEREDSKTLLACLRQAFQTFGGVTAEVLFDNTTTVVIERDAYGPGNHRWHPRGSRPLRTSAASRRGCAGLIARARRAAKQA